MNLLCVDDEPLILEDLVSVCREIDSVCSVESFTKVSDAINFVKDGANEIDVAILDIDMPEMNGLDLAKKLKEIRPRIEIIFLSGFSEFAVDAFKVRASGYLLKPLTPEKIRKEISHLRYPVKGLSVP